MRVLLVFAAGLALAACNQAPKTDPNAKAAGAEVLPGTVSDAMIDLDRSTAQPPLAPHKAAKTAGPEADKDKQPAAKKSGADEDAAPEAVPTPETKAAASPAT